MAPGKVVGGILLPADQLLRVEQLPVCARSHLVNHTRLQVHENGPRDMLPGASLTAQYRSLALVTWFRC
jgi:hypothetical protein